MTYTVIATYGQDSLQFALEAVDIKEAYAKARETARGAFGHPNLQQGMVISVRSKPDDARSAAIEPTPDGVQG